MMNDLPILAIIFVTFQRAGYAVRTIEAINKYLQYDGCVAWYVADDGSAQGHVDMVHETLNGSEVIAHHTEHIGYGAGVNRGWERCEPVTDITLWIEDDWELRRPFDVTPYVKLLRENEAVGMVRLGHLPIDLDLESCGYNGRMYLHVIPSRPYSFSGNPHMKHIRFRNHGSYPVGLNPGKTEVAYDWQVRNTDGPAIWWPLVIGDNPPFGHIGEEKSF